MQPEIQTLLVSGQIARLIPTVADSKKEERATSSLLAAFMVVPSFAKEILSAVGAPSGKKIEIFCYTEVCFKASEKGKNCRPDGLIVITTGGKQWKALVEAKVGNADHKIEQVEEYLDLAKMHNIDAVITISNQFATTPTHHPLKVAKQKIKNVGLYHFSWLAIKSIAVINVDNKKIDDPEQAYILSELVRYLDHDSSGVSALTQMVGEWKDVCTSIQQGAVLTKNMGEVEQVVLSWHQLAKHLSLNLSMKISQSVSLTLSKSRIKDAEVNFLEDCQQLVSKYSLESEFEIPNAASRIQFCADFLRRTINFSMRLEAPKDKARATASINWLTRQLREKNNISDLTLRVYWPRRTAMTSVLLSVALETPEALIPAGVVDLPTHLEIVRVIDLAAKYRGTKTFVEECSKAFPVFYNDVGQHLSKWIAKAPKVKEEKLEVNVLPTILSGHIEADQAAVEDSEFDNMSDSSAI